MQVYKGLDIITNKVTKEERQLCPHHLIDYVSPLHQRYTVTEFRDDALKIVSSADNPAFNSFSHNIYALKTCAVDYGRSHFDLDLQPLD